MKYDYIIAGAGVAGLSLLYRILLHPQLKKKAILVVDRAPKEENDRTLCFWEEGEGLFEPIIRHQWKELVFKTEGFSKQFDLGNYSYKMIQGLSLYQYVVEAATKFDNVDFVFDEILEVNVSNDLAMLSTNSRKYFASYLFNSTSFFLPKITPENSLLQHFLGWEVRSKSDHFDPTVGTLMDFSIDQKHGDTFMYVLPTSNNIALVECTLFTAKVLDMAEYRRTVEQYLRQNLGLLDYEILVEEYGIIPMSKRTFPRAYEKRIIHIGTAAGNTKASSGYTFQFIQKHSERIVERLARKKSPLIQKSIREKTFHWYDKTLLDVMMTEKMAGKEVFELMFQKLDLEKIFRFLGNESTLKEDIQIMWSVPTWKFLTSAIKQLAIKS